MTYGNPPVPESSSARCTMTPRALGNVPFNGEAAPVRAAGRSLLHHSAHQRWRSRAEDSPHPTLPPHPPPAQQTRRCLRRSLLTEKMGKPSPTTARTVDVMVPSWNGYWMLLSLQKKPL